MKKSLIFLVITLLILVPLVSAQTYSASERFIDNAKMFFSSGDNKVKLALEIREKEVNSAIENIQNGNENDSAKNLLKARQKLQIVQEKVSLNVADEVKESVDKIKGKINESEGLSKDFELYSLEEEKTKLKAELTLKIFEYCKTLAQEDFDLMLKEEECNPDTAIPGLEEELIELKDIQIKSFVKLMLEIRSCVDDPGTCNCEANVDINEKAKCEEMVALAMKCEYKQDETSCNELKAMEPKEGDNFAESFVPDFLLNLFREKSYMIEYDINHSDGVPEECWDENNKSECEQYDYLKETKDDWDEYGNYIGKRPKNKEPTMQESIPQCFDKTNNFLEEKCGKITIIRNEEGLVNYIIEKEIDKIINEFENKSAQHTIDINGTEGQTKIREVAGQIGKVNNEIKGWVVVNSMVEDNRTSTSGGLTREVKTDVDSGKYGGDDGLTPEIKTYVEGDGTDNNEVIEGGNGGYAPGTVAGENSPGDTIDETYDDNQIVSGDGGGTGGTEAGGEKRN